MFKKISDKILINLNTLKGTGKPFTEVYDYITLEGETYPYCCFEATEFSAVTLDNCSNERTYTYEIVVLQEASSRKNAKDIIQKSIDDIIEVIDKNRTLGLSEVKRVEPVSGRIEPFIIKNGKTLVGTLIVNVITYYELI